ncbi:TPA: zonular occludens toxin domain-containing protein, partial [Escherichia coli]
GITCDLVVMNQSVANLPRFIKDRIETTYRMTKLVSLGLRNRYRVDVFTGIKLFKSNLTVSYQCKYDKAIFPLYKSHENGQGKELVVDTRQNIFKSPKLWFLVLFLFILTFCSLYYLYWFFNTSMGTTEKTESESTQSPLMVSDMKGTAQAYSPKNQPDLSSEWRIAGRFSKDGKSWIILADSSGRLRIEPSSQFNFDGLMVTGELDGQRVTIYSGVLK